jgi:tetratricopeptide (TPR) repeat protein
LALGESAAIYDTVAIVYHVTGQRAEAQRYLAKAIATVSPDADEWEEIMTNGAEMYFAWGDTARAKEITANLSKRPAKHALNRQRLRRLIARIQTAGKPGPTIAQ